MTTFSDKHYYEDFYFELITQQYKFYKAVFEKSQTCVFKDFGFPSELIFGADLFPAIIEILIGMIPRTQLTNTIFTESDGSSYSASICSFHKSTIPIIESDVLPIPKAFACVGACQEVANNFSIMAHRFKREQLFIDIPYEKTIDATKYVAKQLESAFGTLCKIGGNSIQMDRLSEIIRKSRSDKIDT